MQKQSMLHKATNDIICIENNNLYDALNEEIKQKISVKVEKIECEDFDTDIIVLDPTCSCALHQIKQDKELYENHIIKEEIVIGPEIIQEKSANFSNNKTPTNLGDVSKHDVVNHLKVPWNATVKCLYCNKTFTKRSNLKRHHNYFCQKKDDTAKKKNNEKLKYGMFRHPFICDYCKKSYTHKHSLITHIKSHLGESHKIKYQCHMCEKKYTKKHNLSCHINSVHLKVKHYHCKYCKRKFAWRFSLISHEKTHFMKKTKV